MAGESLLVTEGNVVGARIELGDEFLIGRAASNDEGHLGDDSELSRYHAKISRRPGDQLMIEDIGSANGTFLNGRRVIEAERLMPGDTINVGTTVLEVLDASSSTQPATRLAATHASEPGRQRESERQDLGPAVRTPAERVAAGLSGHPLAVIPAGPPGQQADDEEPASAGLAEVEPTILGMATSMAELALGSAKLYARARLTHEELQGISTKLGRILLIANLDPPSPSLNQPATISFFLLNGTKRSVSGDVATDFGASIRVDKLAPGGVSTGSFQYIPTAVGRNQSVAVAFHPDGPRARSRSAEALDDLLMRDIIVFDVRSDYILEVNDAYQNPPGPTEDSWNTAVCHGHTAFDEAHLLDDDNLEWAPVLSRDDEMGGDAAISGTVCEAHLSGFDDDFDRDMPFIHPFHNDWEVYVAPDEPYIPLLSPTQGQDPDPGYLFAHDYAGSKGISALKGFLGVEIQRGFIPAAYRASAGDRVAMLGRWIVDCGHDNFTTEIHEPLVFAVGHAAPVTRTMGVLILSAAANFQSVVETSTPITTDNAPNFVFGAGDFNGDKFADLYGIQTRNTESGAVEAHILDDANGLQNFLLHAATPITIDDAANFVFGVGDFNRDGIADIYAIKVQNTGSGNVEAHILDGANNFQSFLLQAATPITIDDAANFVFGVGDFNLDGIADIYAIKVQNTGSGNVEAHILDGANNFQSFLLHAATPITLDDAANLVYAVGDSTQDGYADIWAIKVGETGGNMTQGSALEEQARTTVQVIGRPFFVSQKFRNGHSLTNELVVGFGERLDEAHAALFLPPTLFAIRPMELRPKVISPPFRGPRTLPLTIRPPIPRPTPTSILRLSCHFTVRSGVTVTVDSTGYDGEVLLTISMDDREYLPASLPAPVNVNVQWDGSHGLMRTFNDDEKKKLRGVIGAAGALDTMVALVWKNGIDTDRYYLPPPASSHDHENTMGGIVTRDGIVARVGTGYVIDDEQPYPIYGWVSLHWSTLVFHEPPIDVASLVARSFAVRQLDL